MKNGKPAGPDDIQIEMMKMYNENKIKLLTRIFYNIYKKIKIQNKWFKLNF